MPRFLLLITLFLLPCLLLPGWAAAQEDDEAASQETAAPEAAGANIYTVKGVEVDIKGASASKARDKAFAEGSRKAFDTLAQKLSAAGKINAKKLDDATLQGLIKSFEVEKEKASGGRYIATLTFHFKQPSVEGFFASRGIEIHEDPYAPAVAAGDAPAAKDAEKPLILVLPVMRLADRTVLFEEPTAWRRAWETYLSDNPQKDVVIAEGTMEDVRTITGSEALSGMRPSLQKLMERYHAKSVIVPMLPSATMVPEPSQDLSITVARYDMNGNLHGNYTVPLYAEKGRKTPEWLQSGVGMAMGTLRDAMQKETGSLASMNPGINPGMPGAAPPGAPPGAIPPNARITQLTLTIPFTFDEDWPNARAAVQDLQGVSRFDTVSINRTRGVVRMAYAGARQDFERALAEKGYQLVAPAVADGTFILLPAGQTVTPQGTIPAPATSIQRQPQAVFTTTYPQPPSPAIEPVIIDPALDAPHDTPEPQEDMQ